MRKFILLGICLVVSVGGVFAQDKMTAKTDDQTCRYDGGRKRALNVGRKCLHLRS